jgi:hypothetical protein
MFRIISAPFFLSAFIAAVVLFAAIKTVFGQAALQPPPIVAAPLVQPQPPMLIEPADADAFREVIETTIPPRYNGAIIRWYTAILQRQQAKAAAEAKAREDVGNK